MPEPPSEDLFLNAAAREAGLSNDVWHQAFTLFLHEADRLKLYGPKRLQHTVRVPSALGPLDVLVRCQPDPGEALIFRFTAFPAGPGSEVHQLSGDYRRDGESRPVLGEAVLLDEAYFNW